MKREVIVAIVLSAMALIAADKTTSSRSESFSISKDERHHTLTFTNFEAESEYSVSVGASGGKFVSASAPSGIIVTPADQSELFSSATATKTAGALPDSFNFVFSGYFRPDGDAEGGSDLPWDVEVGTKFYYIKSNQENGEKEIIVPAGTSVTYTAYEGANTKSSNWTVNGQSKNNESSIIFNRSWWDVPGWFSESMGTPDPGIYNISATQADDNNKSDHGEMTVVGIEKLQLKQGTEPWKDAEEKYSVYVEDDLQIKALVEPHGIDWPLDTPIWEGNVIASSSNDTKVVDTSHADEFTIIAKCGTSQRCVDIEVKPIELKIPPAILRDGKAENPQNTLQIKAGNKQYKLKISVTEGTGAAVFSGNKTEIEYTGKASDEWDSIFIQGVLESSQTNNIKIAILSDDKEIASVTTIVYSEIKNAFSSDARQHKDSTEECLICTANDENILDPPPLGHTTGFIHSVTFRMFCSHCDSYCAHCCLSLLKGGTQDSYRALGRPSLTENHNAGMTEYDIDQYMPTVTTPITYENIYLKFKANPSSRFIAGMNDHAYIAYGVQKNTEDGRITDGMIFTWEPTDGALEKHSVSEIISLHE